MASEGFGELVVRARSAVLSAFAETRSSTAMPTTSQHVLLLLITATPTRALVAARPSTLRSRDAWLGRGSAPRMMAEDAASLRVKLSALTREVSTLRRAASRVPTLEKTCERYKNDVMKDTESLQENLKCQTDVTI